jgi:hypothetical protein
MPVERYLWKQSFTKVSVPNWPCPTCPRGRLRLVQDSLSYAETEESRWSNFGEDSSLFDKAYAFAAWIQCDSCHDKISCCGTGGYEQVEGADEEGNPYLEDEMYFSPLYFSLPMMIFRPPHKCPPQIIAEVRRSFAVFFCDLAAAANHVRQCVELILLNAGIEARAADGRFIRFEQRLEQFRTRHPENADRVSALRWIGNFGSHPEPLRKDDLFDAYDILEVLLEELFVGHQRSVRQMVEQIVAKKGPRS